MRILSLARGSLAAALLLLAACGGGTPVASHPPAATPLTVSVSAGAPLAGAQVDVYVLDDSGAVRTSRPDRGLLASGTTDKTGVAAITLPAPTTMDEYVSGLVQLVAHGASVAYDDPSDPITRISLPTDLHLTTTISYTSGIGTALAAPVTLWTTLADAAALAYAQGRHPSSSAPMTLAAAMAITDPLLAQHMSRTITWDVRRVAPVSLTTPPAQSLRDAALAALPDIALNQLARELSISGSVTPGQVITAPILVRTLVADLAADGRLDGHGPAGAQLETAGTPPYYYSGSTTRFDLAQALDHWLALAANKSGLTHFDLQSAGVLDAITSDACMLYPADDTSHPQFDSVAPSVIVSISCLGADSQTRGPIGSSRYISGTCTVTADASDPSGVASLALRLDGRVLATDPDQSTSSHARATIAAAQLPDGPLQLATLAADKRGNAGTTAVALAVDNTPPAIAVTQPSASAYYSASVPFDAAATDAGCGVASLTSSGYSGLADTDPTLPHLAATWTVPSPIADGIYSDGSLRACDACGNCASEIPTLHLDRTPPALTWVQAPPAATSSATIQVTVSATDPGAAVSRVWSKVQGQRNIQLGPSAPWTGVLPLPNLGTNTILAWAEDAAVDAAGERPNSGQGGQAPYQLTATIIYDSVPPTASLRAGRYYDERGMTVATDSSGRARVPASYSYAGSSPTSIPTTGAQIYKAATRLAWTTQPTAAQLEGANPDNIPWLQFAVPYIAGTDAPIATARYSVAISCPSCTTTPPTATGDLWPSSASATNAVLYDLPLASDIIPGLAGITGPATLTITLTVTDTAGNTATPAPTYSIGWHTIGPPLAIVEDTGYAAVDDLRGTRHYRIATGSYSALFDATYLATTCADGQVRLLRYLVTNPAPVPVAFHLTPSGTWSITETWPASVAAELGTRSCGGLAASCTSRIRTCCDPSGAPKSSASTSTDTPRVTSAGLRAAAYGQAGGADVATAMAGTWIVPAAADGPGVVAVYIGRPTTAPARSYQPTLPWVAASSLYRYAAGEVWGVTVSDKIVCCSLECGGACPRTCQCLAESQGWSATGTSYQRTLTQAADVITGTAQLTTQATAGGALIGETATGPALTLSVSITH